MPGHPDYQYDLPPDLVAQDPPAERGGSRLLVAERHAAVRGIGDFADLPTWLRAGDVLVVNDSRVLPARLWGERVDTGGRVELLLVRPHADQPAHWEAMARPARRLRAGVELALCREGDGVRLGPTVRVAGRLETGEVLIAPPDGTTLVELAESHGSLPLPHYIQRDPRAEDAESRAARDRRRYQTVYAEADAGGAGSVAAPTAGLHFDDTMLDRLRAGGVELARVCLHVGPGTFQPPSAEQIAAARLHPESFHCPAETSAALARCRRRGGRIIAVGTTSLRVLSTVASLGLPDSPPSGGSLDFAHDPAAPPVFAGRAEHGAAGWDVRGTTRLFLRPPDAVPAADGLLTNFHLPGSSLIMLVAAFAGEQLWRQAYRQAVSARMRFYSYGDAMLLIPAEDPNS